MKENETSISSHGHLKPSRESEIHCGAHNQMLRGVIPPLERLSLPMGLRQGSGLTDRSIEGRATRSFSSVIKVMVEPACTQCIAPLCTRSGCNRSPNKRRSATYGPSSSSPASTIRKRMEKTNQSRFHTLPQSRKTPRLRGLSASTPAAAPLFCAPPASIISLLYPSPRSLQRLPENPEGAPKPCP